MAVQPIPEGYRTVTPYLTVGDATALLDFVQRAFDARVHYMMKGPDGRVAHADVIIGDSHVMMGQAASSWKPFPASLYLYVPDCDAAYKKLIAAGGTSVQEPQTQFYGDRHGCATDANGNQWWVATHVEDVSNDELDRRAAQMRQKTS